ncbi:MAG: glutamate--tRNA ligase, partial [Rhodospirillales bacterium]|nr:glutamate--tRNA ligase [Rhodospirillales bacterium]
LRMDDTDLARSTPEFAESIEQDLTWLGLHWDVLERQSERLAAYDAAFERLKESGRVYPCFETPEELEYKRRRQLKSGNPPVYDRAALSMSDAQRAECEAEGRTPHWRFKLNHEEISFDDLVRGPVNFNGTNLSDPVLVRGDGSYLYMMPSAVDDVDMKVTHVLRGEDHVTNSAIQIQLFEALGASAPVFAHLALLTDAGGGGLSKRLGSLSLGEMREQGLEAMAINSLLAHLGTSDNIEPCNDIEELAADFDLTHFGRAAPKFDPERLWALNARLLHITSFEDIAPRLAEIELDKMDAPFWEAVRANLEKLSDVAIWHTVCFGDIEPVIESDDGEFLSAATELLPPEPWDETTWSAWTGAIKQATGRKGKPLFMPLRLALRGLDHGPELKHLLPLMGRARVLTRLPK